jgi:hypothetical protein
MSGGAARLFFGETKPKSRKWVCFYNIEGWPGLAGWPAVFEFVESCRIGAGGRRGFWPWLLRARATIFGWPFAARGLRGVCEALRQVVKESRGRAGKNAVSGEFWGARMGGVMAPVHKDYTHCFRKNHETVDRQRWPVRAQVLGDARLRLNPQSPR